MQLILTLVIFLIISCYSEERVKVSNKEAYANLKDTIASVKKSCGEVCDQSIEGSI